MKKAILLLLVTMIAISGALASCASWGSVSKVKAITDSNGMARISVDGYSTAICTIDETFLGKTLPGIEVSAGEQEGVGLIYADDNNNNYFPQLVFLNHGLSETKAIYLPLAPVGEKKWAVSEPVGVHLHPDDLNEMASCKYSELGFLLDREFPDLRVIAFIFDEEISDIKQSTVSICKSPFPEVAYIHCQEEKGIAGFGIVPGSYVRGWEKAMSTMSPRVYAQTGLEVAAVVALVALIGGYISFQDEIDEALGFPKVPTVWEVQQQHKKTIQQQQTTIQQQQRTINDLQRRVAALERGQQTQKPPTSQGTSQPQTPPQTTPLPPLNVNLGGSTVTNVSGSGHEGIGGGSGGYGGGGGCNDGCVR